MFGSQHISQNFIQSEALASTIVALAQFDKPDHVIEIGPGKGILTHELATHCGKVTAIEIDPMLSKELKSTYQHAPHVHILNQDILQYELPKKSYKVFSNIPFHITADIMRKLFFTKNAPSDAYLIIQKEAVEKFSGEKGSTKVSALLYPWFQFETLWYFKQSDFTPAPKVDIVLVKITKRQTPLLQNTDEVHYRQFISYSFGKWKSNLKLALKDIFTYNQWKRLAKENNFNLKAKASELNGAQWLSLFNFYDRSNKICK